MTYIRPGSVRNLMKSVVTAKEKGLTSGTAEFFVSYAEYQITEVLKLACELAEVDGRKGVTKDHIAKAMEKMGIDASKF